MQGSAGIERGRHALHHFPCCCLWQGVCEAKAPLVLRYCTTEVKQTKTKLDKAILVKGVDQHMNFNMIPRPISDMHKKAEALAQSLIQIIRDVSNGPSTSEACV